MTMIYRNQCFTPVGRGDLVTKSESTDSGWPKTQDRGGWAEEATDHLIRCFRTYQDGQF